MNPSATLHDLSLAEIEDEVVRQSHLRHVIEHAAHCLPAQGPITVFVHHNTLHAFQGLPFEEAVSKGLETYGCQPYLPEAQYRAELARGRILSKDLAAVLMEDLGDDADELLGFMGTRYHLRQAMLEHPLRLGTEAEIRWVIAETDALNHFRPETPGSLRLHGIDETRRWVLRDLSNGQGLADRRIMETLSGLFRQFDRSSIESWSDGVWETFTLHLLWRICHQGVHNLPRFQEGEREPLRHRDVLRQLTGIDTDDLVNDMLIRFCAAFLDQGFASWPLPQRDLGFFKCFLSLYRGPVSVDAWLSGLSAEIQRIEREELGPLDCIEESLEVLGVSPHERDEFISQTLLALPGWAGMLWQMETNAEWTILPAPSETLVEYLAVRLILERRALVHVARESGHDGAPLSALRARWRHHIRHAPHVSVDQRAYLVFQLAQVRGWTPADLHRLSKSEWSRLVRELESFSSLERRRIYHLAYERGYRNQALDAIGLHARRPPVSQPSHKSFQLVTCIDDREESFRRHLEESDPACETFGMAGFYAVAMYHKGLAEAHFRPLCPVVIKPRHYVTEEAAYSLKASSRQRAEARRVVGTAVHQWHVASRRFVGGMLTALLGSLMSIPMVTRILFPRLTAKLNSALQSLMRPPLVTELRLMRTVDPPGPDGEQIGYTIDEMAGCVERVLRDVGLTREFARLVLIVGHGSGSLNNPHESAYNCGACSGGRGGPNARAFAQMANHPQVRLILKSRGLVIPESTVFVGGYHNTCDEDVVYYDLDRIPMSHRREFETTRDTVDDARGRNAQERCRRFESADVRLTPQQALDHVQGRAEDLSQARPEYNHATNAMCFVGRRARTRGLFLDRRTFLTDYDPTQDGPDSPILSRILAAAVPVCAGISLEYYFSCVDVAGYGCGSKLPHNIVSLLGVMEGAASDLRTGLSQQMIEIHEPLRILFVIETTPQAMLGIMQRDAGIEQLIVNKWVQLAVLDPHSPRIQLYQEGQFVPYEPESGHLSVVSSSREWYQGQRDHLGFAEIVAGSASRPAEPAEVA